jgi:hypothetical protein
MRPRTLRTTVYELITIGMMTRDYPLEHVNGSIVAHA